MGIVQFDDQSIVDHLFEQGQRVATAQNPYGSRFLLSRRYTLDAAHVDNADDVLELLWMPHGFWIIGGSIWFEDEVDTGTDTLVWDAVLRDDNGVADARKLIEGATAGVNAGEGAVFGAGGVGVYAGERWIALDVTTAANAAAGGGLLLSVDLQFGQPYEDEGISFDAI